MGIPPAHYDSNAGYYYVEFFVDGTKDEHLMSSFQSIRIENGIDTTYPVVFIEFMIDNQVFIEKNLYPQKELRMDIWYSDEDNKIKPEPIIFNLLILEMNVDLPQKYYKNISEFQNLERRKTILACVPKQCYELMNVTINRMWSDSVTVKEAIMSTIKELNIPSTHIEEDKMNTTSLKQLLVPPMSFRNFLLYMNDKYGIYNGKLYFYMNYNGTFRMWELKKKYDDGKPDGIYVVHKLPEYTESKEMYEEPARLARTTDNNFVTYDNMKTICKPTDPFIKEGAVQLHVFHPNYDISKLTDFDPVKNAKDNGLHSGKNKDLKQWENNIHLKRIVVHDDKVGDENGSGYSTSMLANYINPAYEMNYVKFKILRKIPPHLMMRCGEPMRLKCYAENERYEKSDYSGLYLITQSILSFTRNQGSGMGKDTVFARCDVIVCRTSQSGDDTVSDNNTNSDVDKSTS